MKNKQEVIALAKKYLRGENIVSEDNFDDLYQNLMKYDQYGYASEILLNKIEENSINGIKINLSDYQKLARNIYKDTSLSSYFKFDKAINILNAHCNLSDTHNPETLRLAGSIYKYKWKFNHQFHNLLQSRAYYKKGNAIWKNGIESNPSTETDYANNTINFAYINELIVIEILEQLSEITGVTDETIRRFETCQDIREEILMAYLDPNDKDQITIKKNVKSNEWIYAALAESFFGLRKYKQSLHFINLFTEGKTENWQIKSFSEQMHHLAFFQSVEKKHELIALDPFQTKFINESWQSKCLSALNIQDNQNKKAADVKPKKQERLGLGLSGGGFRSALFHIGVLAGLAEKDTLRDIEIISCVSGGSIIGAFYYLKLKQLLESKTDDEITQQDYINLVTSIELDFLKAVQKNIRVRLLTNIFQNFKMLVGKQYSRSHRLGELYETHFYNPILFANPKCTDAIYMNDLSINPKNHENFDIYNDNWKRKNKIPRLILNATTVNTGHNWQFTTTWMGEPPTYISDNFDVKPRMRRMYYQDAPNEYKKFRLGYAVAASSCVPVLFEPLLLKGLYKDVDLELIDGGVHDNQGIASILEQECNAIIVSDGSAQMPDNTKGNANEVSLFFRVDAILQERLRETQLLDLKSRQYTSSVNNLQIVHLKNGLTQLPISWVNCTDVNRGVLFDNEIEEENALLEYGLMKKIQKLLSEVRTDLDSFNDMEAYALMFSGYQQIMHENVTNINLNKGKWTFMKIKESCQLPEKEAILIKQLKVSKYVPFKIIRMSKLLSYTILTIGILILGYISYHLFKNWSNPEPFFTYRMSYNFVSLTLVVFLAGFISKFIAQIINIEGFIKKKTVLVGILLLGFIFSNFYLYLINPWYNKLGKLQK
jgi:predicted acylesterase/phospholipase RssA